LALSSNFSRWNAQTGSLWSSVLAGKLNWHGRDLYVRVYTFANREGHRTSLVKKDRVGALVDIVEVGPAYPPTALVTSEQMASEINRTGRIALYGLYFDTSRTEIKSESKPTLEQIADLLKREPSLKLLVVGHTDNVGDFKSNRDLSQRRAESVANALVTGFGIAPDRLVQAARFVKPILRPTGSSPRVSRIFLTAAATRYASSRLKEEIRDENGSI
jgi:outer membrane protein OmpA-like peptidoglycan-associated protein